MQIEPHIVDVPVKGEHGWERDVRKGQPVLICKQCGKIWWPDRTLKQQGTCRFSGRGRQ